MLPNIFYIHSHDTGRFISPYGYPVRTPNLDAFARQSTLFHQAFCGNPTCSPSRAVLLTGQCAHSAGMLGLTHRGFGLRDPRQHLAAFLGRHGYETALCGVQHEGDPVANGYQEVIEVSDKRKSSLVSVAATEFLKKADRRRPLFMSIGYFDTHRPFAAADPEDDPRYTAPFPLFSNTPEIRADAAAFNSSAHRLDTAIGQALEAIGRHGGGSDSIIIVTTDHGPPFPDMKSTLYDLGIGVMLMVRLPAGLGVPRVATIDAPVSQMDIFPTLCELLGIDSPEWLQGESLLPLWHGATATMRGAIFAEMNYHTCYEPMRAIRTDRYKYIRTYDLHDRRILGNVPPGEPRDHLKTHGYFSVPTPEEQLFDLAVDPLERINRIDDPSLADIRADLCKRLEKWMQETDDPILNGPLPMLDSYRIAPRNQGWEDEG